MADAFKSPYPSGTGVTGADPGGYMDMFEDLGSGPDYYTEFFTDPRFAARDALRNTGIHPRSGPFAQWIQNQFGQGDDFLTLHRLRQGKDDQEALPTAEHGSMLTDFASDYIGTMGGLDTGVSTFTFQDVGDVLTDFVSGVGDYAQSQAYDGLATAIKEGDHGGQFEELRNVFLSMSHTMSDVRRRGIQGAIRDMYDQYLGQQTSIEGSGRSFMDFVAENAADTIMGRYFDF